MDPGETDLGLELDAGDPEHPGTHRRGVCCGGLKQDSLAHPCLADDHERTAADSCPRHKIVEDVELTRSADQPWRVAPTGKRTLSEPHRLRVEVRHHNWTLAAKPGGRP